MSDTRVTTVLILADTAVGQEWEKMLQGPETRVWLGRAAIPAGEHPEVIVINACAPPVRAPCTQGHGRRDEVGVIRVGGDGPADVRLSCPCTTEELQLACRLLGEVVRLRRLQRLSFEAHRELAHAALTDPLTGLANRRAWDQELARRLTEAVHHVGHHVPMVVVGGPRLCLAVLDLDQFKEINDTQGHAAGDRVLQAVGHSLQTNLRHGDFLARLGGDEFGLLLWVPGEAEAAAIVERVRSRVGEAVGDGGAVKITASAGFALSGKLSEPDTCESLFLAADAALIAAKRGGRNTLQGGDSQQPA